MRVTKKKSFGQGDRSAAVEKRKGLRAETTEKSADIGEKLHDGKNNASKNIKKGIVQFSYLVQDERSSWFCESRLGISTPPMVLQAPCRSALFTAKRLKAMGSQALQKALWLVLPIAPWFPDAYMFLPWDRVWSTRNHNLQDKGNSITWLIVPDFSVYEGDFIILLTYLS